MRVCPAEGTLRGPWNDWLGRGPKTKEGRLWLHAGIDLFNRGGPVISPEAGRVVYSVYPIPTGRSVFGGYSPGGVVAISGDSGFFHWLGHVVNPVVKRNEYVQARQTVALSTPDHVHWEIRQQLIPYSGQLWWPWTVTIDPYRWLLYRELTAMDAINYCRSQLPGDEWKDPSKRLALLRAPLTQQNHPIYPIRMKWTTEIKTDVRQESEKIRAGIARRNQKQIIEIAAGLFAGLAIVAALAT